MKHFMFITYTVSLFLVLLFSAHALRISDNMHFTILENGFQCVDVILPDDALVFERGTFEYYLTMEPEPIRTWGDLSEQIVRTDENNTVLIPICFSRFGLGPGNCSEPYTFSIDVPELEINRSFSGGVCISEYQDLDFGQGDSWEILTLDSDIFDIGFSDTVVHSQPEQVVDFDLLIQSYAEIDLDLQVLSTLAVNPQQDSVSLGPSNPLATRSFSVTSPSQEGEYTLSIKGTIRDCDGLFCEKEAQASLMVSQDTPDLTGFSVSLFPSNLNVREYNPVECQFRIENHDSQENFTISISIPPEMATTFEPGTLVVPPGEDRTMAFTVTPSPEKDFYVIRVNAESGGITRYDVATLSVGEMLGDADMSLNDFSNSEPDTLDQVNNALDEFQNTYANTDYGQELNAFTDLQDTLNTARQNRTTDNITNNINGQNGNTPEPQGINIWIIIGIVAVVVVLLIVYALKKSQTNNMEEQEYF